MSRYSAKFEEQLTRKEMHIEVTRRMLLELIGENDVRGFVAEITQGVFLDVIL